MPDDLARWVGANLRAHRRRLGVTQQGAAQLLGVGRPYYGDVERGERNLSLRTVERIAERLDVDPFDLLREPR